MTLKLEWPFYVKFCLSAKFKIYLYGQRHDIYGESHMRARSLFMPPSNVLFLSCSFVRASAYVSRNIVNLSCRVFDTFSRNLHYRSMHCGTEMSASHFGIKRSKVKVTVEYNMLETALLVFTTPLGGGLPYPTTWFRVIFI